MTAAQTQSSGGEISSFGSLVTSATKATALGTPSESTYSTTVASVSSSAIVPNTSSHHGSNKSSGSSAGLLAGVAVGAAVGAAILATFVTWMLLRSKRRPRGQSRGQQHSLLRAKDHKDAAKVSVTESPSSSISQKHGWEQHLPQPVDDVSLRFSAKSLFHQIELHVENFYLDTSRPGNTIPADAQARLRQFHSIDMPTSALLQMQQGRNAAVVIKHCLAKYIVSKIDISEVENRSFLPVEFTILPAPTRKHNNLERPVIHQASSQWRVLTAYLRADLDAATVRRDAVTQDCANEFSSAFAPWAAPSSSDVDRVQNLTEIMRNAAQFGELIFSQASNFQYIWRSASKAKAHNRSQSRESGSIVVTPGLVKITDEKARPLHPVQVVVPPVTADL